MSKINTSKVVMETVGVIKASNISAGQYASLQIGTEKENPKQLTEPFEYFLLYFSNQNLFLLIKTLFMPTIFELIDLFLVFVIKR